MRRMESKYRPLWNERKSRTDLGEAMRLLFERKTSAAIGLTDGSCIESDELLAWDRVRGEEAWRAARQMRPLPPWGIYSGAGTTTNSWRFSAYSSSIRRFFSCWRRWARRPAGKRRRGGRKDLAAQCTTKNLTSCENSDFGLSRKRWIAI